MAFTNPLPTPNLSTGVGSAPTPNIVPLDQGTQNIINSQVQQAGQDPSSYSGMLNQNLGAASNLQKSGALAQQQDQATGSNPATMQAIRGAYAEQANSGINALQNQNQLQGAMMKADFMSKVSQVLLGQQVTAANQFQTLSNAFSAENNARAGTINTIFQVGDQGIGMYAASQAQKSGSASAQPATNNVGGYDTSVGDTYGYGNSSSGGLSPGVEI